jgi:elongation factor 1-beta
VIVAIPKVIPKGVKVIETKIAPVAFGLMKVNVGFVIDDEDESIGGMLEKALSSIKGIENIECVSTTVL